MPELLLAAVTIAALLWCLLCTVRQLHTDTATVSWLWRQARADGWSEWADLQGMAPTADYDAVLAAVRASADIDAIAVQFASVSRPLGAPDFTRVVFTSAVRDLAVRHA